MMIIGCDFHTRYQQIAMMEEATGELTERRLDHQSGEADAFYRELAGGAAFGFELMRDVRSGRLWHREKVMIPPR